MTNLKTWWQKLKYWQKGAIIGIPASVIIAYAFFGIYVKIAFLRPIYFILFYSVPMLVADLLLKCSGEDCIAIVFILTIIWILFLGFIIGALIGLIIGKIKKNKFIPTL